MKNQVTDLAFSERYCKACMEREVPASILYEKMMACEGKTPEEQRTLKNQFADEIPKKYPKKHRTIFSHISSDAKHQLLIYKNTGGAAGFAAVWVKAVGTGKRWDDKEAWGLYSYSDASIDAEWVDNETIRVFSTDKFKAGQIDFTMNIYPAEDLRTPIELLRERLEAQDYCLAFR